MSSGPSQANVQFPLKRGQAKLLEKTILEPEQKESRTRTLQIVWVILYYIVLFYCRAPNQTLTCFFLLTAWQKHCKEYVVNILQLLTNSKFLLEQFNM